MNGDSEVDKIEAAAKAFSGLDRDAAERAIAWLHDRFVVNAEPKLSAKEQMKLIVKIAVTQAESVASEKERSACASIIETFTLMDAPPLTPELKDYILRRDLAMSATLRARAHKGEG